MRSALLALALAGCGGLIQNQAASSTLKILEQSNTAARRLVDPALAREAMPSGIVQLDAFALAYPDRREFRVLHADALCQYANAFVFDDWEDATLTGRPADASHVAARLDRLLGACIDANRALLPRTLADALLPRSAADPRSSTDTRAPADSPSPAAPRAPADSPSPAAPRSPAALKTALASATRADVPALRWIATATALRLALAPLQHLPDLPLITATLERCVALWPGFHDADAELTLGMIAANKPAFLDGDGGAHYFELAQRQLGDGALMLEVLRARALLVRARDRDGFIAAMRRVLDADVTRWPERRLANELARIKAARYLAAADQLFPSNLKPSLPPQ